MGASVHSAARTAPQVARVALGRSRGGPLRRVRMKVLILLFGFTQIWAQSLQILPAPPTGTMERSFQIMIVSPASKSLSALQWRISISGNLTVSGERITAGSAAGSVQKFITCAAVKGQDNPRNGVVCVLVGGTLPIPNGPIAVVRFTARPGTP